MKKIKSTIKLQIMAGQATPAPPIGPILGQHGLNIAEFCKQFNDRSKDMSGDIIPVRITVFQDNTYSFVLKTPLASSLIKKAVNVKKGSSSPLQEKVGKISKSKIEEIAKIKMPDLNTNNLEQACKIIQGTARQMGIETEE
ncbi:50S ribosomal protein L11 [Patescibacteria group bacterium]|nr:50S ribosomal protein L11 [Patescibacteria group bacterium]